MCLICVHFEAEKLTAMEALNNLDEMAESIGEEHAKEVTSMILKKEIDKTLEEVLDVIDGSFDDLSTMDWDDSWLDDSF